MAGFRAQCLARRGRFALFSAQNEVECGCFGQKTPESPHDYHSGGSLNDPNALRGIDTPGSAASPEGGHAGRRLVVSRATHRVGALLAAPRQPRGARLVTNAGLKSAPNTTTVLYKLACIGDNGGHIPYAEVRR